ncbi:unnamed protein product [Chrysodeixis includens]|uniref:Replication factor C subunit 1 n=1 Tax=Chrysodeixis includens TaxID=689277 RepID=A0A9P0FUC7_CHRIL|nr:unnamed protein product [Chrysodeixis includens]
MSRDIRSFFQLKKAPKPTVEDDDDVIPESPDVQITKPKKKDIKKRAIIKDDSSDEEIFSKKTKKTSNDQATNKNKSPKPALKEVKVTDMFGKEPIKRTKPLINKKKKTELGIHSDEEFEKSLLEIDNEELDSKSNKHEDEEPSPSKIKEEKQSPNSNSDSNKTDKTPSKKKSNSNNIESQLETSKTPNRNYDSDTKTSKTSKNSQSVSISNDSSKKSKVENSKRKFAEFLEDGHPDQDNKKKKLNESRTKSEEIDEDMDSFIDDSEDSNKNKKKKFNKSLNESVLTDEERHERKMHSAALYKSYLNRSGPKNLGAKEIPEGKPNCLKDCAFVLTGVLDSFEKDEITAAINKYGGVVKSGVTKKVTHVLAGEDGGPAKMAKAQELGIQIINEDQFLKMITDRSQDKPIKIEIKKENKKEKSPSKKNSKDKLSPKDKDNHVENKSKKSPMDKIKTESKSNTSISKSKLDVNESKNHDKFKSPKIKEEKVEIKVEPSSSKASSHVSSTTSKVTEHPANVSMWVEKYKPQNIKQIIGQHGEASNVKKLMNWLTKWYVNRQAKLPKPNPYAHNDDGGYYKAVLLSGPPGVGKTTTVSLVCKELGFDTVEFNASDTRNKTLIKEQIGELLNMTSLKGFAQGQTGKQALTKKHVLVMDEVDGMAGNEDRGGLQELIGLIKTTSVPIICMCNDRNSQKMRSLVNYCYDLRFQRPKLEQIKAAMMSICCKEGLRVPADALSQLITSASHDVRQTLNLLSLWAARAAGEPDDLRADAKVARKDIKLGPWDVIDKVFSAEEHKTMSISDKCDLFFYDYSLGPLFVQENYLTVEPRCPKHEVLQRISRAADSISLGDLVETKIRRSQAWSLLPTQAIFSSVLPGFEMSGCKKGRTQFPGWLGKNSRATKFQRLCQEIHAHTRLSTSGSKSSIFLDYSSHIRDAIVNPLIKDKADGVAKSLEVLESYNLMREDLDSLVELSLWPGKRDPTVLIDSKVKAAMTRLYNKSAPALPYAPASVKRGRAKAEDELGAEDEPEDDEPPDSDPESDALIKKKKTKEADKPKAAKSQTKAKPSSSKKKKEK